jgi:hypothetical protein
VSLIELNAWEDERLVEIGALQEGRKKNQRWQKRRDFFLNDLICEQYTNACKLGANWNGKDFKNHTSWSK